MSTLYSPSGTSPILRITSPQVEIPKISSEDLLERAYHPVRMDLKQVETFLRDQLESKVEGVPQMMAYLIESGGKRIRPLVTCLLARAAGYRGKDHIPLACVAELLHTATLYHDDVVDDATLRRGKPTANQMFGNKIIVLAGDLMLAHSFALLMDGGFFSASQALSHTVKQMVEGEILQLQSEGNLETTIYDYMEIIEDKTASLFSWCGKAAAVIADQPDKIEPLSQFGYQLGIAFQLVDDIIDFTGDEEQTGKGLFKDLMEGKITLPLLLVLEKNPQLKEPLKNELKEIHQKTSKIDLSTYSTLHKVKQITRESWVKEQCNYYVENAIDQARNALSILDSSRYRTSIFSLLEYLTQRDR